MKLFGSKNKNDDDQVLDDTVMQEEFDETPAVDPGLTAPARQGASGGSGRKKALGILLLLVAGGMGGGYVYLTQMMEADHYVAPAAVAQATEQPAPAEPTPAETIAAIDPLAVPPAEGAVDPLGATPPDAAEPVMVEGEIPPPDMQIPDMQTADTATPVPAEGALPAVTDVAVPDAADAAAVAGAPAAADAAVPEVADTGAATADAAATEAPAMDLPVVESDAMPPAEDHMSLPTAPMPAEETAAASAAQQGAAVPETSPEAATPSADAVTKAAGVDAMQDLPLPEMPAAVKTAPAAAETATQPAAANAATAAAPTAAEKAIVENAAVLETMTPPAATAQGGAGISSEQAMVRPLPKQYLVVQKDRSAGDIDSRLSAARLALAQGRLTAALQLFNELYDEFPRDKRVLMGKALTQQRLGQNVQALGTYEEVLSRDPKNLEALTNMLGLLKNENAGLAVEKLLELRNAYPYNADIAAQLGIAYAGAGEYTEAMKYLDMADSLKPGSVSIMYNRAVLLDKMGNAAAAGDAYRAILRMASEGRLDADLPLDAIRRRLATLR